MIIFISLSFFFSAVFFFLPSTGCFFFVMEHVITFSLLPIPWQPEVIRDTRPLRIAYYDYDGYLEASPACRRAVQEAVKVLKDAGHELVPFTPPNVRDGLGIFFALLSSGAEHVASELQGEQIAEALKKLMLNVSRFLVLL